MKEYSKKVKKLVREYARKAHEEELRRALVPLSEAFDSWKDSGISSDELSELIHEFNRGPSRELFKRYSGPMLALMVASAVARGILDKDNIPPELLDQLADQIDFCKKEGIVG